MEVRTLGKTRFPGTKLVHLRMTTIRRTAVNPRLRLHRTAASSTYALSERASIDCGLRSLMKSAQIVHPAQSE